MEALILVIFTILAIISVSVCAPQSSVPGIFTLGVPAECTENSFCAVEPEGYVDIKPKLDELLPDYLKRVHADDNARRIGTNITLTTDFNDCTVEIISHPVMYKIGDDEWGLIVQTDLFKQELKIVRCAQRQHTRGNSEREECWSEYNLSKFGLKSSCVTTYASRTLYVYDGNKEKIVAKSLRVPVCCTCKIHFD